MFCYLFTEHFNGTRENVFIKGLLVYKSKHINVRHWGHVTNLFASNWFCLLVLSLQDPSGILWRVCSPMSVDMVSSGTGTAWLCGHTGMKGSLLEVTIAHPNPSCTALLHLFIYVDMLPVLDFSVLRLESEHGCWYLRINGFGACPLTLAFRRSMCYFGIKWGLLGH